MELNVRDWLIILGSLVAAGFILDAYRRVRAGYSDKLRLGAKQRDDEEELSNPELPGGGARVVSRSKTVPSYEKDGYERDSGEESHLSTGDQGPVPVLMDSVEDLPDTSLPEAAGSAPDQSEESPISAAENEVETRASAVDSLGELAYAPGESPAEPASPPPLETPAAKPKAGSRRADAERTGTNNKQPDEIIVLHVVATGDAEISGSALLQILLACDVRYGRMNIFHRYEEQGGEGAEQFSVVNMVAPGTFDLDDMDNFSSPGVSFFMKLPGPKEAIKAFDCMVETAQCLIKNLDCELHDEAHSVVTTQTLQHLRQRIRDFERRQLTLLTR